MLSETFPRANQSAVRLFDRLHVLVREPEMMADLVDENMGHDLIEGILALTPEAEQRPTIGAASCWVKFARLTRPCRL